MKTFYSCFSFLQEKDIMGENSSGKVCTCYGIINHTVDECYKKHSYPPSHKVYKLHGVSVNNTVKEEENVSSSETSDNGHDIKITQQ